MNSPVPCHICHAPAPLTGVMVCQECVPKIEKASAIDAANETLRLQVVRLMDARDIERQKREAAERVAAERFVALKGFACDLCDENHKFTPECQNCLGGEGPCTCCNEEAIDCPYCRGEQKELYAKLEHALSSTAGSDYFSREQLRPITEVLGFLENDNVASYYGCVEKAVKRAKELRLL